MDSERVNKWATFWFFLPSSIALAYFVFYLTTFTPVQPPTHSPSDRADGLSAPSIISDDVTLVKGLPQTVGKVKLTYLGIEADAVVIDVTILELDPQYAYRRIIPTHIAEQGFYMAQQQYRLISAGHSKLKIIRTHS